MGVSARTLLVGANVALFVLAGASTAAWAAHPAPSGAVFLQCATHEAGQDGPAADETIFKIDGQQIFQWSPETRSWNTQCEPADFRSCDVSADKYSWKFIQRKNSNGSKQKWRSIAIDRASGKYTSTLWNDDAPPHSFAGSCDKTADPARPR